MSLQRQKREKNNFLLRRSRCPNDKIKILMPDNKIELAKSLKKILILLFFQRYDIINLKNYCSYPVVPADTQKRF